MTRPPRSAFVGLALAGLCFLLVVSLAPQAQAQDRAPGFGEVVGDLDTEEAEHEIATSGAADQVSFRDADGDGALDNGEAVFLAQGSTTEAGDVRLANPIEGSSLEKVGAGDSDTVLDLTSLAGQIRFFDSDYNGHISEGDAVYHDLDDGRSDQVSQNDVILTGPNAGSLVSSGNERFGNGLDTVTTSPTFGYYDRDTDGNDDTADAAVVDIDADGWMSVSDVRLTETNTSAGGTIVAAGDQDVTYTLEGFDDNWGFEHRDPDGNDGFGTSEAAYITTGEDVATFAVRVANPPSDHGEGTQVIEQDSDWRISTVDLTGGLAHDGDGDLSSGDVLYYDVDGDDEVDRGDIRLTGNDAGRVVSGGDDDVGTGVSAYNGDLRYFDANGNDVYDGTDIVYADTDNDDIVESYDVQLSDARDPYASDDGGSDGDDTDAEPGTVEITSPEEGAEIWSNETITVEGTADGGDSDVDEVQLNASGGLHSIGGVEGTTDWTASFTPEETTSFTLTASVHPVDGDEATATVNVTAVDRQDSDEDGVFDDEDDCPEESNPEQADRDDDGEGDACDEDRDGDGIRNDVDECPDEEGKPADDGCPLTPEEPGEGNETDGTEPADGEEPTPNETNGSEEPVGEDQEGVPTAGAGLLALALAGVAVLARRR